MSSRCPACPVSLLCLAGQLRILMYCELCRHLIFQKPSTEKYYHGQIPVERTACDKKDANELGTVLSVCTSCKQQRRHRAVP